MNDGSGTGPKVTARACAALLFDLDGTLIDSRADITSALNRALERCGLEPLPLDTVVGIVGEGVRRLVDSALRAGGAGAADETTAQRVLAIYLEEYEAGLLDATRLYPGVAEALDRLGWAPLAVVTNKPARFARRILEGLGIGGRFAAILGGDSHAEQKPRAGPLLEAVARCGAAPEESVMVGDSAVDVLAGRAAGLFTCGLASGFRGREELVRAGCDLVLERFSQIPEHFQPARRA